MKIKTALQLLAFVAFVLGGYFLVRQLAVPQAVVAPVARGTALLSATGNVTVLPEIDSRVVSPVQSLLLRFPFKEGDTVKKGEVVAQLDPGERPFQLELLKTELANLDRRLADGSISQFRLDAQVEDFGKNQQLHAGGHLSGIALRESEVNAAETKFRIATEKSDLEYLRRRIQVQIEQLEDQLARLQLRAPFDGVVMTPLVLEGDTVFGGTGICNITSTNRLIKVEVNQDDLEAVRGSKRVIVRFFSFGDDTYEGAVKNLLPIGNSATQRFTVFLEMKSLPAKLLSGQTGEATFIADEHPDALLIPRSALFGDNVFVVGPEGRVQQRPVKTGFLSLTTAEVLEGVSEGDLVITKDVDQQRAGGRVKATRHR